MEKIKGFKGFDKDLKCRDQQYEVGQEYSMDGEVKACASGFHFCENPLDVLAYYEPNSSRYAEVEGSGNSSRDTDDSKVAVSKLHISAEITLNGLLKAGVKFILDRVKWEDAPATNTGHSSAATNTGHRSAATVSGEESVAISIGIEGFAKGALGCWIVLAEWQVDESFNWHRTDVQCFKVDGERIKADTFYVLQAGQPVVHGCDKIEAA